MTRDSDHPLVVKYLEHFDMVAGSLSPSRRAALRDDIATHLRDQITVDTSNADASAALTSFGSPSDILEQEVDGISPKRPPLRRRTRRGITIAISATGTALVLGASLFTWMLANGPTTPAVSIVNKAPEGPSRVARGTAYFEYRNAIDAMAKPLPAGADYPEGVPEGLDSGPFSGGVMQSGAGKVVAHFTWLCAWEYEYLNAVTAKDAKRQVMAEAMLNSWSTSPIWAAIDPDGGWARNVLDPMGMGDKGGVIEDLPQSCLQAGIINVRD
jgi:hypothetical protein